MNVVPYGWSEGCSMTHTGNPTWRLRRDEEEQRVWQLQGDLRHPLSQPPRYIDEEGEAD